MLLLLISVSSIASVFLLTYIGFNIFSKHYDSYEERYLQDTASALDQMFIFIPPERLLYIKFLCATVLFAVGFLVTFQVPLIIVRVVVGAGLGVVGYFIPELVIKRLIAKRIDKFEHQLVDALNVLSNSLKAGFSFNQSIGLLVQETKPPISQEFSLVLKENRLGVKMEEALEHLAGRLPSEDLRLLVTSIQITREVGGNLAKIFDRIAHTIRERMKLKGKIDALTSQGRLQGLIVGCMPIGLGLILFKLNPELMLPMVTTAFGWALIGVIIVFEIVGGLLIKKIITIDV